MKSGMDDGTPDNVGLVRTSFIIPIFSDGTEHTVWASNLIKICALGAVCGQLLCSDQ
jgi:hypothetical protein